jgi:Tfp pilus assembly protein PilV
MISRGAAFMRSRSAVFIIALVLLAAATVLILIFTSDAESRSIALLLGSALVTLVGALHNSLMTDKVERKVEEVAGNVNGRMSQILDKVPDQPRGPETTTPEGKPSP